MKIDFCEADVLDAFDEWRRAAGGRAGGRITGGRARHGVAVVVAARPPRTGGHAVDGGAGDRERLMPAFDALIDRVARELDAARRRRAVCAARRGRRCWPRLAALDDELLQARATLDEAALAALPQRGGRRARGYRDRMAAEAFARARDAAVDRLVRERFGLPIVTFDVRPLA